MGPLLESPNSNLNLPLFTLCTNDFMNVSGDSGMQPLSHPLHYMASGMLSFKLPRLNIIVVMSLLESNSSKCGQVLWPLVIKGPLPSIQVHWRFDSCGDWHGGLVEKEVLWLPLPNGFCCAGKRLACKMLVFPFGLVLVSFESDEYAGVGGIVWVSMLWMWCARGTRIRML